MAARPDPYQPATPPTPTASGTPMQQASVGVGDLLKSFPALGELEDVSVPVRAGDCIVVRIFRPAALSSTAADPRRPAQHNALTAHAAGANMSFERRRAMVLHLMPEDENRFNGNVRNPFLTLEDREVMGVGDALDETRGGGGELGFTFPLLATG